MQQIKVILADDHRIFLEGLRTILENNKTKNIEVVATTGSGKQLIELLEENEVHLIIFELNLQELDGLEVLQRLKKAKHFKKLALTRYDHSKLIKSAFKYGVDGYLLKKADTSELFMAVDELLDGKNFTGEGVQVQSGNGHIDKSKNNKKVFKDGFIKKHSLTKREMEILSLITQALSNKQIAEELFISDQTVSVHRKNIMRKLGVSNTAGLIKEAYENLLVK